LGLKKLLENKTVLIVDDTMFNIIALKMLIKNATNNNVVIHEAYNGQQALFKV
jgi:YesN/AraC family two-component response regulator